MKVFETSPSLWPTFCESGAYLLPSLPPPPQSSMAEVDNVLRSHIVWRCQGNCRRDLKFNKSGSFSKFEFDNFLCPANDANNIQVIYRRRRFLTLPIPESWVNCKKFAAPSEYRTGVLRDLDFSSITTRLPSSPTNTFNGGPEGNVRESVNSFCSHSVRKI